MWWTRIVGALVLLLIATYLIQWLVPRSRSRGMPRGQYLRWDIAPIVGFFGALLLVLSFVEAGRRDVIAQWGWGAALGVTVSAFAWALLVYRVNHAAREKTSVRRFAQRYGALAFATMLGLYLAVRVFGAALEVFVAAALGLLVIALAAAMFVGNKPITEDHDGK